MGTADPSRPKGCPPPCESYSVHTPGRRRNVQCDDIYLPSSVFHMMEPCFPGESIHEFLFLASFVCINFALPIKLSFSEPMNFLPPSLPILFPVTLREVGQVSGWVCGVEMLTGVKPQEME